MSKLDLNLYYLQMQNQYFRQLEILKEYKRLADEGIWTPEQLEVQLAQIRQLKTNYERLSYCMWELNKPSQKNSKKRNNKYTDHYQQCFDSLKGASRQAAIDENADVLVDFKKYIEEGRGKIVDGNSN